MEETMKAYVAPYDLDRYPLVALACRAAAVLVVTVTGAVMLAGAGPGNGYQAPEQWAAVHRNDVTRIDLPRVQVIGQSAGTQSVAAVACPKGA
jgi:hypothetical protein